MPKKTLAALSLLLLLAAPLAAQSADDGGGLFGMYGGDAAAAIAAAQAEQAREDAELQAQRERGLRWRTLVALRFSEDCVASAVAGRLGVTLSPDVPLPEVRYKSELRPYEFQAIFGEEYGRDLPAPKSAVTHYFPKANLIVLEDSRFSHLGRSIDAALAGQLTYFLYYRYRGGPAMPARAQSEMAAVASGVESWFDDGFAAHPTCQ